MSSLPPSGSVKTPNGFAAHVQAVMLVDEDGNYVGGNGGGGAGGGSMKITQAYTNSNPVLLPELTAVPFLQGGIDTAGLLEDFTPHLAGTEEFEAVSFLVFGALNGGADAVAGDTVTLMVGYSTTLDATGFVGAVAAWSIPVPLPGDGGGSNASFALRAPTRAIEPGVERNILLLAACARDGVTLATPTLEIHILS